MLLLLGEEEAAADHFGTRVQQFACLPVSSEALREGCRQSAGFACGTRMASWAINAPLTSILAEVKGIWQHRSNNGEMVTESDMADLANVDRHRVNVQCA